MGTERGLWWPWAPSASPSCPGFGQCFHRKALGLSCVASASSMGTKWPQRAQISSCPVPKRAVGEGCGHEPHTPSLPWGGGTGRGRPGCLCPALWWGGRAGLRAQGPVGNTGECPHSPAVRTAGLEVSPGQGRARPQEDGGPETVTGARRRARCAGTNRAWQGFSDITREAPIPSTLPRRLKINA